MLQLDVAKHVDALRALCRQEHIDECVIFGSAARSDFGPASDIDIVVAFAPTERVSSFRLSRIAREMEGIVGRPVDLHTWAEIHPKLRAKIRQEGVPILERKTG